MKTLYDKVSHELEKANIMHNPDYIKLIINEIDSSDCSKERFFLRKILKNEKIASNKKTPLCQDTGILVFYIYFPPEFTEFSELEETISKAVSDVYIKNDFRDSVRAIDGKKIKGNLPCSFLYFPHNEKKLVIKFIVKGGGSENVSTLFKLLPSSDKDEIYDSIVDHFRQIKDRGCPPYFAGICIGGSMETSVIASRIALMDLEFDNMNKVEKKLIEKINSIKTGVFGTGYGRTCLALKIVEKPFHIASLFVAVSVCCHQFRRGEIRMDI